MSGGVSATTTGPNATQQMYARHSARRYFSIHTGTLRRARPATSENNHHRQESQYGRSYYPRHKGCVNPIGGPPDPEAGANLGDRANVRCRAALKSRSLSWRALYAIKSEFPFWPQEWRHTTPVSPVRATAKRLSIGSAPDGLLSAPVQLKIAPFVTTTRSEPSD